MKKIVWFLALVQIWLNPLGAQTEEDQSLLWKISGKNLTAPSYLFCTIHMIVKNDYFFTETMQEDFDATAQVTFEINMEEMSDMGAMMPVMMKAFMSDNITLRDLLEPESYEIVQAHFNDLGLPMMFLDRIKPMFLSA